MRKGLKELNYKYRLVFDVIVSLMLLLIFSGFLFQKPLIANNEIEIILAFVLLFLIW
jgi:hypothetical protein